MLARALAASAVLLAGPAAGLDSTAWPPPSPVGERMHELQHVIGNPQSTAEQRQAARDELANLLKSPAGQSPHAQKMAPRAAVEPGARIVKPLEPVAPGDAPPVAHVEVLSPPQPVATPSGPVLVPSGKFAVDPRTGAVLHPVPGGYVDPRSGKFTPVPGH
jgi:hypothetical protein